MQNHRMTPAERIGNGTNQDGKRCPEATRTPRDGVKVRTPPGVRERMVKAGNGPLGPKGQSQSGRFVRTDVCGRLKEAGMLLRIGERHPRTRYRAIQEQDLQGGGEAS